MGDLGFEPRTSGLRVRCATVALVTLIHSYYQARLTKATLSFKRQKL